MSFRLDPTVDITGTSWASDIAIAPADVRRVFGPVRRVTDSYKVSACYSFTDGDRVFTLYDWKSTSLYQDDLPAPLLFWNSHDKTTFSIGSDHEEVADFRAWVLQQTFEYRHP